MKKPAVAEAPVTAEASSPDVALIHGVTSDGGYRILRARDNRLELGAVRPLREGTPIHGEVVKLKPRENCPVLCDVEVQLKAPEQAGDRQVPAPELNTARSGPAQVATDDYRKNWDAIWSRPAQKEKLAN
ncbi:MAG TPA: hypothetical protein VHV51_09435 [Polyangiaceae bacterium]|jgi:hypothetical protein|nr:hypothetical protein [Polyangiaceae bacterium]